MNILPIPAGLLPDSVTLMSPSDTGYSSLEISGVRVLYKSQVREYSSAAVRDTSEITVYYDCVNSSPAETEFSAGMLILYGGRRYEILSAEEFKADAPHHIRITARSV